MLHHPEISDKAHLLCQKIFWLLSNIFSLKMGVNIISQMVDEYNLIEHITSILSTRNGISINESLILLNIIVKQSKDDILAIVLF